MRKLVLDVAGPRWFGELIRNQGRLGGQQVVAQKAVASILQVPSVSNQERVARTNRAGTGYSNFWWYPAKTDGALYASGRFGQRLYVDPKNELAIAQFGSYADTRARAVSSGQATATHENALRDSQALVALARAVSGRIGGVAR